MAQRQRAAVVHERFLWVLLIVCRYLRLITIVVFFISRQKSET